MSVIFRPPVKINGSWLKPRTLSPRPDTRPMFQVSSAPLPVSRASASFEVPPEDLDAAVRTRDRETPRHTSHHIQAVRRINSKMAKSGAPAPFLGGCCTKVTKAPRNPGARASDGRRMVNKQPRRPPNVAEDPDNRSP